MDESKSKLDKAIEEMGKVSYCLIHCDRGEAFVHQGRVTRIVAHKESCGFSKN